ncbi:MAG TPA: threonine/serine dehydratase [Burkholderiales bacterium]|jgi:threonine dehydratase|nr:threonine/serine dehydratase [Burkholderiales bacterium]
MQLPTFRDVLAARRRIRVHLKPTPLYRYAPLDALIGTEVWVKHENYQPVGAFKVRGGVNLVSSLSEEERRCGVVTASTGNHGQSIAFAARLFGVKAYICVPHAANPGKLAAIRGMGAEVMEHGERFEDAVRYAQRLARDKGYRFIHSANEPLLIAGVATEALEILEEQPDVDTIFVPVGLGSGASGACLAAKAVSREIRVVAVQAAASPAVHDSWRSGRVEVRPNQTFAEGLATGEAAEMTLEILSRHLDEFLLVSEEEIRQGMVWWLERCHTLAESAAGAVLAAVYRQRAMLKGRKVAIVCSGGNTSLPHLKEALNA